jgi:hypothetical protein
MNQRTTGLVVGLVTFVILTVALAAASIYFFVQMQDAKDKAKNAGDAQRIAQEKDRKTEEAYGQLVGFVMGDPNARPDGGVEKIKEALNASSVGNLKSELEGLRAKLTQMEQDKANLDKAVAAANADAQAARTQAKEAQESAQAAAKGVGAAIDEHKSLTEKYGTEVSTTVASVKRVQDEVEERRRNEVAGLQGQIDQISSSKAELSTRVAELQKSVDQYRVKPANAAALADGRVIDVSGTDGQIFISIGAKQRVQPGMIFDVYDDANSIQFNPTNGELVPGKARIVVLKVGDATSTARVVPDNTRGAKTRPIVQDDVIANAIYSPDYRYKFLVHGKFDIDGDGIATAAEADYVRGRIRAWGGEVVDGDKLRGDLDFIVLGQAPQQPPTPPADADTGAYTAFVEARRAFDTYQALFSEAQAAHIPILNWNRMQVLTNEGR